MQSFIRSGRVLTVALLLAVLVPAAAHARFDGMVKTNSCGGCHGNQATGSLSVSVSGPATVLPSSTTSYTLTIDPLPVGGAFSLDTDAGTVTATDANTKNMNGNVTFVDAFSAAPAGSIGDWEYSFDLTAPGLVGTTLTLSFAGMAFNGDFSATSADIWNIGSRSIEVIPEPGTGLLMGMGLGILGAVGRRQAVRRSLRAR
jgi:hypothetical protein